MDILFSTPYIFSTSYGIDKIEIKKINKNPHVKIKTKKIKKI